MGAGTSLPEHLDIETVQALAGRRFDETKFNSIAVQGKITEMQFEELVRSGSALLPFQLEQSDKKAAELLEKAAEQGDAEAQSTKAMVW
jgi:TPR repeat protein